MCMSAKTGSSLLCVGKGHFVYSTPSYFLNKSCNILDFVIISITNHFDITYMNLFYMTSSITLRTQIWQPEIISAVAYYTTRKQDIASRRLCHTLSKGISIYEWTSQCILAFPYFNINNCNSSCRWSKGPTVRIVDARFNIDGLVQERRNSSVLAMQLRLSCIDPSKWISTINVFLKIK